MPFEKTPQPCPAEPLQGLRPLTKILILLLLSSQVVFCWMSREKSLGGDVDLRASYAAGSMMRRGEAAHLYDAATVTQVQQQLFGAKGKTLPFLYPAFAAVPFVPLSLLSYSTVFILFLTTNVTCLYGSARLLTGLPFASSPPAIWLFICFLCFFPTAIALMQGQTSCVLLLLLVLSYCMAVRGRMFIAGLCLALALIKFQFVLPIILLHIFWRRWRVLAGFVCGGTCLVALVFLLTGVQGMKAYTACLEGLGSMMLLDPALAQTHFGMQTSAEPNLHGLVAMMGVSPNSILILLVLSVAAILWAVCNCRTAATALPAAMLVSYHMQPYDLLLLLLPLTLLLCSTWKRDLLHLRLAPVVLIASVLLLMFPVAPYLLAGAKTTWFILPVLGVLFAGMRYGEPEFTAVRPD